MNHRPAPPAPQPGLRRHDASRIVELRQYTLHPGRRDDLVTLFHREFVHTQEAAGIAVLATFVDLDDPDRFVWLRGFPDMPSRAEALQRFYGGPTWAQHRDAANATMIDSDDVLLLRPAAPNAAWPRGGAPAIAAVIPWTGAPADPMQAASPLAEVGATPLAVLETEPSPNNFPRLPVREGVSVRVVLARVADTAASHRAAHALRQRLPAGSQVLRLSPCS